MKRFAEILGLGFFAGIALEAAGVIFGVRWLVGLGVLLMMPLLLGIAVALSALAAEKVEGAAISIFGKGLLSKSIFWIVLVVIAAVFLFAGSPEVRGPSFWGSIG